MLRSTKDTMVYTRAWSARGMDTNANRKVLDHTLANLASVSRSARIYSGSPFRRYIA